MVLSKCKDCGGGFYIFIDFQAQAEYHQDPSQQFKGDCIQQLSLLAQGYSLSRPGK
jgi:hypothetical protein